METEIENVARVFAADVNFHITRDMLLNVDIKPAYRGGPRVGYRPTGNMKVTIKPETFGIAAKPYSKTFYIKPQLELFRKNLDKYKDEILCIESACRLVFIYRKSGLIPKHIAKKHGKIAKEKFGDVSIYESREQINFLWDKMSKYLRQFAKCPHCNKKFNGKETILGFTCDHCEATLTDIGNPIHWENV